MKRNDKGGNSQDERWKMVRSDKMYWHWSQAYLFLSLIVNRFLFVTSKEKRSLMKWKLFKKDISIFVVTIIQNDVKIFHLWFIIMITLSQSFKGNNSHISNSG